MSLTTSKILSTMIGERPIDGSSISSTLGRAISARPIASICCSPPLIVPASWWRRSFRRGKIANTRSDVGGDLLDVVADEGAHLQVLGDRHAREDAAPLGHHHQALLDQSHGPWPRMLRPMNSISPPAAAWVPVIAFSVVVLPAPLAPIS
jgi:hypothetical protein